jgi:hypothetical protein
VANSTAQGAQATGSIESIADAFSKRAADRGVGHHGRVRADRYPGGRRRNSASGGLR